MANAYKRPTEVAHGFHKTFQSPPIHETWRFSRRQRCRHSLPAAFRCSGVAGARGGFSRRRLDSLHPYAYSGGGINGIWLHIIEPLAVMDFTRQEYVGVLADSWEFQGRKWIFQLRHNIRFHNGAPFTAKDVAYSIERMNNRQTQHARQRHRRHRKLKPPTTSPSFSLPNSRSRCLLDRLDTRYIISKAAAEKYGDQARQLRHRHRSLQVCRAGSAAANLVLARNDDYWGAKAEIKEVILKGVKGRSRAGCRLTFRPSRRNQQSAHRGN